MEIENFDLIKEKLNKKLAPVTCPMCKSKLGFSPYAEEIQQISCNREGNVLDLDEAKFIKTVSIRCNNCGFLALFDINGLLE